MAARRRKFQLLNPPYIVSIPFHTDTITTATLSIEECSPTQPTYRLNGFPSDSLTPRTSPSPSSHFLVPRRVLRLPAHPSNPATRHPSISSLAPRHAHSRARARKLVRSTVGKGKASRRRRVKPAGVAAVARRARRGSLRCRSRRVRREDYQIRSRCWADNVGLKLWIQHLG